MPLKRQTGFFGPAQDLFDKYAEATVDAYGRMADDAGEALEKGIAWSLMDKDEHDAWLEGRW